MKKFPQFTLTRKFHPFFNPIRRFSLTPCFSWVWKRREKGNRFNGLSHTVETVETVPTSANSNLTQLKQGVNEKIFGARSRVYKTFRLGAAALLMMVLFASRIFAAEKDDPIRWEKDIQQFEAADKTNPPPKKAILFIGSSSIRICKTLAADLPEHKVINRGFGGSFMNDSVFYFDRIVAPYKPKTIVIYAGGNDINFGKTPEDVFVAFTNFVAKAHQALPKTRVAYISIAPNPSRWSQVEQVKAANKLIEDFIKKDSKLAFINVFPAMLGEDGKPKPDIFLQDNLHMNAKGYAIWVPIVRPYLEN